LGNFGYGKGKGNGNFGSLIGSGARESGVMYRECQRVSSPLYCTPCQSDTTYQQQPRLGFVSTNRPGMRHVALSASYYAAQISGHVAELQR
jgi:hypothetical protein